MLPWNHEIRFCVCVLFSVFSSIMDCEMHESGVTRYLLIWLYTSWMFLKLLFRRVALIGVFICFDGTCCEVGLHVNLVRFCEMMVLTMPFEVEAS